MVHLGRDEILRAQDLRRQVVHVPQWGGDVLIQELTAAEMDAYQASVLELKGKDYRVRVEGAGLKLVARSIIDEAGNRIFTDGETALLGAKGAGAVQLIFDAAMRLNGLSKDDLEELVGNSEDAQPEPLATA